jgi:homopolymeric O-antigen transport system permease protein
MPGGSLGRPGIRTVTAHTTEVCIEPSRGWAALRLQDVWEYRELLYFLVWRDIKIRYKQTVLGAGWAILQPFFTMVIFAIFFGRLAKLPSDGVPYPIFAYAALVPWTFFSNGLTQAINSVVGGGSLIKKVYFPRMIMPLAAVMAGIVDFLFAFIVLIGMVLYFGIVPTWRIVTLPMFVGMVIVAALSVALWLSALNVQYRDIRYIAPFIVQAWLFATPIAYPSSLLSDSWRIVYGLNPMVGVVEGFRWALLGTGTAPGAMIVVSSAMCVALLLGGAYYFRRVERTFADVV